MTEKGNPQKHANEPKGLLVYSGYSLTMLSNNNYFVMSILSAATLFVSCKSEIRAFEIAMHREISSHLKMGNSSTSKSFTACGLKCGFLPPEKECEAHIKKYWDDDFLHLEHGNNITCFRYDFVPIIDLLGPSNFG